MDLEPGTMYVVRAGPFNQLHLWVDRAGDNWAKGHYTGSAKLIDPVWDVVRADPFGQPFRPNNLIFGQTGAGE